jgi:hypothetical protein
VLPFLVVVLTVGSAAGSVAARSAQRVECTGTRNPFVGQGDGSPGHSSTNQKYVKQVLVHGRREFRKQYPHLRALRVVSGTAYTWRTDEHGNAVRDGTVKNYWIEVSLAARRHCPRAPGFFNGVPLKFVVIRT